MTTLARFLEFIARPQPRFAMNIPERTSYEEMVFNYERGDPDMLHTLKAARKYSHTQSDAEELARWKQYAKAERQELRPEVAVSHGLQASPDGESLAWLKQALNGASPALLDFYRQFDGGQFYADERDPECGVLFFPAAEMAAEPEYLQAWLDEDEEYWEEIPAEGELEAFGTPPWLQTAVIFGGIGAAAERFMLPTEGEHRGAVFEFIHDPFCFRRLAPSFEAFLEWLMREPLKVAEMVGLYDASEYRTGPWPASGAT